MCGAMQLKRARNGRPHTVAWTIARARRRNRRVKRTAKGREALRQQRSDFVGAHGDERARRRSVVTPHRTTGQDGEDGQEQARGKPAATAVGDGRVTAKTPRMTSIPPYQRATDSHDYTRLTTLKVLNAPIDETHVAFKESGHWPAAGSRRRCSILIEPRIVTTP